VAVNAGRVSPCGSHRGRPASCCVSGDFDRRKAGTLSGAGLPVATVRVTRTGEGSFITYSRLAPPNRRRVTIPDQDGSPDQLPDRSRSQPGTGPTGPGHGSRKRKGTKRRKKNADDQNIIKRGIPCEQFRVRFSEVLFLHLPAQMMRGHVSAVAAFAPPRTSPSSLRRSLRLGPAVMDTGPACLGVTPSL
jgi:hypothetical protein